MSSVSFVAGLSDRDNGMMTWHPTGAFSGDVELTGPVAECLGQFDYQYRLRVTDSDGLFVDLPISSKFDGPVDISITAVDPIYLSQTHLPVANVGSLTTNMGLAGSGTLTYTLGATGYDNSLFTMTSAGA